MQEVQMDMISKDKLENMSSRDKIRFILDKVKIGRIVVLEKGLTPKEEASLIEVTMTEIAADKFSGIEIETYPIKNEGSFIDRIRGKTADKRRLTVIGPADQLRTVEKGQYQISTKVSIGDDI